MNTGGKIHKEEGGFWNFIDSIKGDKVVWIIVFLLTMVSALAIFSSTSQLVGASRDRLDLIREHALFIIIGYILIFTIYYFGRIGVMKWLSRWGFALSFGLLLILDTHANLGFIRAERINGAWRTLRLFGFQLHVFEIVKVAMVMYLAWALHSYGKDQEAAARRKESPSFRTLNRLAKNPSLKFLGTARWKRIIHLYLPVITVTVMTKPGSNSSMILIGGICLLILLIGKMPFKEIALILASGVAAIGLCMGIYYASGKTVFEDMRFDEIVTRFRADYSIERLKEIEADPALGAESKEWYKVRDEIRQPYSAKIALHEGGFKGKGSGNSTQKHVVAHIYSDYMFSFIVEEYGLLGGIFILILYVSLLARGSMIAKYCPNDFTRYAVGGLSLLITGQAFMHIYVNIDIGPMTGQTLPMVSDGSFAFLMFCIAFGIILSISKMAREDIREEEEAAAPIYDSEKDDVQAAMDVLEQIDNQ